MILEKGAKVKVITGREGSHNFIKGSIVSFVSMNPAGGYLFEGVQIDTPDWSSDEPVLQWLDEDDFELVVDSE